VTFPKRVVLHCNGEVESSLDRLVEEMLKDGVALVAVAGEDCENVEEIIDELVVGDGSDPARFLTTSSHPGEALAEVVEFAKNWVIESEGEVRVVEL
jgi:hypothetical protein